MATGLNLHCVQCGAALGVNEPTVRKPDGSEICWFCQQPEGYRQMSKISAEPILEWAKMHLGQVCPNVEFVVSHVGLLPNGSGRYARFSHLLVDGEDQYVIQRSDGSIDQIEKEVYEWKAE